MTSENKITAPAPAAAVSVRVEGLKKRADFLAAARARVAHAKGFVLQARDRGDDGPARVGFTCSKKVGNAVARNRAKRRLREIARLDLVTFARPGWDYVLIGRREATATLDFQKMRDDLKKALIEVHS
ncbi:MAG: ribonuclease P protein component [Alphaproteobacteria bacterium]|jgi:ribonuclease P protein component|nr:ribonuclease P protein component [Alphaproteobacteria bacterium]